MTGLELKLARVARGVKAQDVAAAMGITPGRLSRIETTPQTTEAMARRFMAALESVTKAEAA